LASSDSSQRSLLVSCGLFDTAFYAAQTGLVEADLERCVDHYLECEAAERSSPHRLFDRGAYLARHPDVAAANVDPFLHFVEYGIAEGRTNTVPDAYLAQIRSVTPGALTERRIFSQASALGWHADLPSAWADAAVAVYASSLGNCLFRHVANRIADGLRISGVRALRLDQNSARPPDVVADAFVAPHQFFALGAGPSWRHRPEVARSVMLNVEQPGTPEYFRALSYAGPETTLVDLSPQSAVVLHDCGRQRSGFLPLGWLFLSPSNPASSRGSRLPYVPGLDALPGSQDDRCGPEVNEWHERPIDVLFLGTLTTRRSKALGRLASTLSQYSCVIQAPTPSRLPLIAPKYETGGNSSLRLARRAKVLLNLHRDESPYLDWHKITVMGIQQGALVLSEPCWPSPGVEPGRHFLTATLDDIPKSLDGLLRSPDGQAFAARVGELTATELPERFDLGVELRALSFLHREGFSPHA
jgi:hypothetical protein